MSINDVAKLLGVQVKRTGNGSGRSMSFTDLVVRPADAQSDSARLSSQILATGEVKGECQFQLKRAASLQDVLQDPGRIGAVVQAIQQVRTVGEVCIAKDC